MLFAGTPAGVYRVSGPHFDTVEQVLQTGVRQLCPTTDSIYAATGAGLLSSTDGGESWRDLGVPVEDVHAVLVSDEDIYAGVRPAAIYHSTDEGETWTALENFQNASFAASWPTNPHRTHAHVRSLATPGGDAALLVVGVEVGGLVVSPDGGTTFHECQAVPDDVHHVLCRTTERWVVSCGTGGPDGRGGVYQTTDGGDSWDHLDTGSRNYVRESCYQDTLYTAANETPPPWSPPNAAVFVQQKGKLQSVSYPNEPSSFLISWEVTDTHVFAGTNDGHILRGHNEDWEQIATIPVSTDHQQAYGVTSVVHV